MTHDLREALKKLVYRIRQRSTNKLHNREFAMTLDDCVRELSALTASPGEQEPVAGPTCRCHDDVSRKYCLDKDRCTPIAEAQSSTSPPPAAGWNEAITTAVNVAKQSGAKTHPRVEALRREAPAPEGVVKGPIFGGTALCGHHVMAAICEKCNRPDAGGDVREALDRELSGNSGQLLDNIAAAIRGGGSDLCDGAWESLSEDRKAGWRGDADRALSAIKKYLATTAALSNPPDAGNASAEARLREQTAFYRNMSDAPVYSGKHVANILETVFTLSAGGDEAPLCACGFTREACAPNPCHRKKVHLAGLTPGSKWPMTGAGGDEAKKSEGGPLNWQLRDDAKARIAEIDANRRHAALNAGNIVAGSPTPSDPTADRREIVQLHAKEIRTIALDGWSDYHDQDFGTKDDSYKLDCIREHVDAILSALDGGAGE